MVSDIVPITALAIAGDTFAVIAFDVGPTAVLADIPDIESPTWATIVPTFAAAFAANNGDVIASNVDPTVAAAEMPVIVVLGLIDNIGVPNDADVDTPVTTPAFIACPVTTPTAADALTTIEDVAIASNDVATVADDDAPVIVTIVPDIGANVPTFAADEAVDNCVAVENDDGATIAAVADTPGRTEFEVGRSVETVADDATPLIDVTMLSEPIETAVDDDTPLTDADVCDNGPATDADVETPVMDR